MMKVVHASVTGSPVDDATEQRCASDFVEQAGKLVARLADRDWLVGDQLSAADITAACVMRRVRLAELFPFPSELAALDPWIDGVMSHDAGPG